MRRMIPTKKIEVLNKMNVENDVVKVSGAFEQEENNWESQNLTLNSDWLNGLTATSSYVKAIKINKVLYIIISAILSNDTENEISTTAATTIINISLPTTISSKIYRKDGTTCDKTQSTYDGIINSDIKLTGTDGSSPEIKNGLLYSSVLNRLSFWVADGQYYTLSAGTKKFIDVRMSIVL